MPSCALRLRALKTALHLFGGKKVSGNVSGAEELSQGFTHRY